MAQYVDLEKYLDDNFCDEFDECVSNEDCFICWARRHTEDVAPVIHAKIVRANYSGVPICTNCKEPCYVNAPYCYNCGAKLDKE